MSGPEREAPRIVLIYEAEFYSAVLERCRCFGVQPKGVDWILMAAGWLRCCHRCGVAVDLHATERRWGFAPADCPGYRMRVLVKRQPTEVDVLRFIDRIIDVA